MSEVADDLALYEAARPELDHDTLNVPGLAAITETIFDKINVASVFVADLTYVGKSHKETKMLPNPNVLIELGYAFKSLGLERIILVANSAYGAGPDNLPFDLRHRRAPIAFNLPVTASKDDRTREQPDLVKKLKPALAGCLVQVIEQNSAVLEIPGHSARPGERSVWFAAGARIEHLGDSGKTYEWEVPDTTRFYMRFRPAKKDTNLSSVEVKNRYSFYALGPWRHGNGGVNQNGVVAVGYFDEKEITGAAQWFKDTGELWAFSNAVTFERGGIPLLAWRDLPKYVMQYLESSLQFLGKTGVTGPIMIEAGITGLNRVTWPDENYGTYSGHSDEAYFSQTSSTWVEEERYEFIAKTLSAVAETYGRPAISVEHIKAKV
ncbi:MAG: hypothetical protein V4582_23115 [Pseudomonadota bacterium]